MEANIDLTIRQQFRLLNLPSSTFYRKPAHCCERDDRIMRTMDTLHVEDLTRGTRRLTGELTKVGLGIRPTKNLDQLTNSKCSTLLQVKCCT